MKRIMTKVISKQKSKDEMEREFIERIDCIARYWSETPLDSDSIYRRVSGAAFSILATIDGAAINLPSFQLVPITDREDIQYCVDNDIDYYPYAKVSEFDIAGSLHDTYTSTYK